jgi:hypothetical protein
MTPAPCTCAGKVSACRSEIGVELTPSAAPSPSASRVAMMWSTPASRRTYSSCGRLKNEGNGTTVLPAAQAASCATAQSVPLAPSRPITWGKSRRSSAKPATRAASSARVRMELSSDIAGPPSAEVDQSRKTCRVSNMCRRPDIYADSSTDNVAVDGVHAGRKRVVASPSVRIRHARAIGCGEWH